MTGLFKTNLDLSSFCSTGDTSLRDFYILTLPPTIQYQWASIYYALLRTKDPVRSTLVFLSLSIQKLFLLSLQTWFFTLNGKSKCYSFTSWFGKPFTMIKETSSIKMNFKVYIFLKAIRNNNKGLKVFCSFTKDNTE